MSYETSRLKLWRSRGKLLLEQYAAGPSPLKIDKDAGVIFRVKVLGRYSRNTHGLAEAENGTEYTPACMKSALPLYEGSKVKIDHPTDRNRPGVERTIDDTFGVLRNCVVESDENNEPAIWADLHYLKSHELAPRVIEDVERGLGVWGLSHNAAAASERFDTAAKRLVIESIALVRSVDLVDKPATNRNLWESQEHPAVTKTKKFTLRGLLESQRKRFSKTRVGWMDRLLEMDGDNGPMTSEYEAPAVEPDGDEPDPDDALKNGFRAAILAILDGDGTAGEKAAKIKTYLVTHEKLTSDAEPEDVEEAEEDDDKPTDKDKADKDTMESLRAENASLKAAEKVRELCESQEFLPTRVQVKALSRLESDAERKELIATFKAAAKTPAKTPRSVAPGSTAATRSLTESKELDSAEALAILRNG